jgi:uncharacterized protein
MKFIYENTQRTGNLEKHGIDFSVIYGFNFDQAMTLLDTRHHFCTDRFIALGLIGNRLHVVAFTVQENAIRIISLRTANLLEIKTANLKTHPISDREDAVITKAAHADSNNQPLTETEIFGVKPMREAFPHLFKKVQAINNLHRET